MKILTISWWIRKHTNRNHLGMLDSLNDHCEYNAYGRKELEPFEDNLKEKVIELVQKHQPDVLLVYSGLHFMDIPNFFKEIKGCLKIMIESDYHTQKIKERWYIDAGIDYLFFRNGDDTSSVGVPSVWWPWATDEDSFTASDYHNRKNIIGFAGSSVHEFYTIRKRARDILLAHNLLDMRGKSIAQTEYDRSEDVNSIIWCGENGKYQEYLRSLKGFLASTETRGPFAKTFEAMASKTILLSSPIFNKHLFGLNDCYVEYKTDCSDIITQAKFLLNEDLTEMAEKAYQNYLKNHTKKIRIKELYDNIKLILSGKEPIRRWGL